MKDIVDRQLENRSKFVFEFNTGIKSIVRVLHFAENIDVRESIQTNYSEYTPLGSNGSVFTYLGSKSRSFDVNFNLTLPNIMAHTLIKPPTHEKKSTVSKNDYFMESNVLSKSAGRSKQRQEAVLNLNKNYEKFASDFINNIIGDPNDTGKFEELPFPIRNSVSRGITTGAGSDARLTATVKVMYWINLIRGSTMTSAKKPQLGPPIIRLVHGMLYQNVPCIATDYNISHDPNAGYDEVTLLPRVLKVNMKLREVRLRGRDFDPTDAASADMMPGWDSFIEEGFATFDPMNIIPNTKDQGSK
jgi:hypothetical protein